MLFFYKLFTLLYSFGIRLIAPWNPKAKKWLDGRKDIFGKLQKAFAGNTKPVLWMHCASLGEFEQGRPVLEKVRAEYPNVAILLTFFSPSGYEVRKDYGGADWIFYLPLDSRANAEKLLAIANPQLVLWVKYEYWYYYLTAIKKRNIPLLLISGIYRQSQPFFKWYGGMHRKMLDCFTHLFVQNNASKDLLEKINITGNVTVGGDTRFDRVIEIAEGFKPIDVVAHFCFNHKVIVAGSTWDEDEKEMDHYANTHPEIRFVIAPHEIDEDHLQSIEKLFRNTIRFSELKKSIDAGIIADSQIANNVLIIDNIGMLSKLYHYATVTFIGGGFGEDGVHNVLEAAVYGKPVVYGPVYDKYIEAVELEDCGGGISVGSALELEATFNELLNDAEVLEKSAFAARNYVYNHKGATNKVMDHIQEKRLLTN
ncbi:glycosyltransferase N-terminal domain-containing protein [Chitinophagaceae bacterium 26-R-25]|nr:glycosyltransferase N-terminal domain-containing protein [Chitinophagaceae bacterium 26-R-25]